MMLYKMEYFVMLLLLSSLFFTVTGDGQFFQKKSRTSYATFTKYRMQSSYTGFTGFLPRLCYDKNECSINNGGCEQNCHNTYGSYYCSCDSGYILSANNKDCDEGVPETTFQQMSAQQFRYKRRNYQQHHMVSNSIAASQDKLDFQNKEHIQAVPYSQLHSETLPSITTSKQASLNRYATRSIPDANHDLDFYVGAMRNYRGKTTSYQLYIATLSQTDVNYTIKQMSGIITSGTVSISNPAIVSLSASLVSLDNSYMYRNQGIHVHSDGQISLIVVNYGSYSMDIYQAYPHHIFPIFQYQYYAVSIGTYVTYTMSEILLVGNIDNTTITITPTADVTVPIDIQKADSPSETILARTTKIIKLHRFQTFLFGATGVDFSGTSIVSNQPLTVVSGHECGNIPYNVHACGHVSDQIPPTVTWGKKFILTPYNGRTAGQYFKLIASENTTTIMHNCESGVSTMHLAFAGDVDVFYTNYTTYCYLESDKPLLVTQMMPSYHADGITGDPSISIIYPIDQYKEDMSFFSNFPEITQHYINIIATQQDTMLMDDSVLSLSWNSISDLNNEIVGYAAQMTITSLGGHVITSTNNVTFTVLAYGYANYISYSYTAGIRVFDLCEIENGGCEHNCINIGISYYCTCNSGYELHTDRITCHDINECDTNNGGCVYICTNSDGSYTCSCNDGYELNADNHVCDDADECNSNNGACNQTCVNEIGSFHCECDFGYTLDDDGLGCTDVNECSDDINECYHYCHNTIGSYYCTCKSGYRLNDTNERTCHDINECDEDSDGCAHQCTNTISSYYCSCDIGYILDTDVHGCTNINECDTDNGGCDHNCTDSIGSYDCSCDIGYILATDNHECNDQKIQTSVVNDTVSDEQDNNTVIISSVASVIVLIMMIIAVVSVIIVLVLKKRRMMFRRNRSAEVDNSGLEGRKSETLSNEYEGFGTIGVDFTSTNFTNPIYQVVEQPKLQSSYDDDETLKNNPMFNMPLDHYSYIDNTAHHEVIFQLPVAAKKVTPKAKKRDRKYEKGGNGKNTPQIASSKL